MTIHKLSSHIPVWGLLMLIFLGACNSKKEEQEEIYTPSGNVAVTEFSLKANSDVAPNLDAVFFAIDLDARIIFNADSLPVGTDITSLVPVIKYPSTVGKVEIKSDDKTVNYIETPSKAINFTSPVTLTLTSADGTTSRSYTVKVNVHRQNPAQFLWSSEAVAPLPGSATPTIQKTLKFKDETLCFIKSTDGSLMLNRASEPDEEWSSTVLQLTFEPDLRSMAAGQNSLFVLSSDGELFSSQNGYEWNLCNPCLVWNGITGAYLDGVTGLREKDGKLFHTSWGIGDIPESVVEDTFPITGYTTAATIVSPWSPWPTIFVYGGRRADGTLSGDSWGFDGESWTMMSSSSGPAIEDAMLLPYWISRATSSTWLTDDRDAWLIMGGRKEDGTVNREVWYSLDNGVNWKSGGQTMEQPEDMPGFIEADAVVSLKRRSASALTNDETRGRLPVSVEGTTILWDCPMIFVFGGVDGTGATANTIWRATFARFTFTPII